MDIDNHFSCSDWINKNYRLVLRTASLCHTFLIVLPNERQQQQRQIPTKNQQKLINWQQQHCMAIVRTVRAENSVAGIILFISFIVVLLLFTRIDFLYVHVRFFSYPPPPHLSLFHFLSSLRNHVYSIDQCSANAYNNFWYCRGFSRIFVYSQLSDIKLSQLQIHFCSRPHIKMFSSVRSHDEYVSH